MENKKDLGELFKERFAKAEIEPDHSVWEAIEKTLDKKDNRGGGYLWLLIGVGLFLGILSAIYFVEWDNPTDNKVPKLEAPVVDTNQQPENNQAPDNDTTPVTTSDKILVKENQNHEEQKFDHIGTTNTKKVIKSKVDRVARVNTRSTRTVQSPEKSNFIRPGNSDSEPQEKSRKSEVATGIYPDISKSEILENGNVPEKNEVIENKGENINEEKIASYTTNLRKNGDSKKEALNHIAQNHEALEKDSLSNDNTKNQKRLKKVVKTDSSNVNLPEETNQKTYFVHPFVGTSTYGGFSKVSAIDSKLNGNKKTSGIKASYGAYLVFVPKEKWSIRIGAVYNQIEKSTLEAPIAPNDLSTNFYKTIAFANGQSYTSFSNSFDQGEKIELTEKLGYLEIPLEVGYTFYNLNDFGIDAIIGTGVQFSKQNELFAIRNSGQSTLLGANTNYSKGSFGIHLGLGINYKVNQSLKIQLEPIFKPQIGFYENSIGDNPLIFTLRFGVQYKL